MHTSRVLPLALALLLGGAGSAAPSAADQLPTGKGGSTIDQRDAQPSLLSPITYHGGPVMAQSVVAYVIWYGGWSGNTATTIIEDMLRTVSGQPYWMINTNYTNGSGGHVNATVKFGGSTTDAYSQGKSLTDTEVYTVVESAITSGRLPKNTKGVYFVLSSQDVEESSGFCTRYCGWHTYGTISGSTIKYAFAGNPARCFTSCAAQTVGPNGNAGADALASIVMHELEEAATDPQLSAWYDASGQENADKCAWTFGTTYTVNGAMANVHWGSRDFLIQRNWSIPPGQPQICALSFP